MIFLSYSWRDKAVAHKIEARLREVGFPVWIDYRELHPDHDILRQLDAAIFRCRVFAFIEGRDSRRSVWMKKELLIAQTYNKNVLRIATEAPTIELAVKDAWINSPACSASRLQDGVIEAFAP